MFTIFINLRHININYMFYLHIINAKGVSLIFCKNKEEMRKWIKKKW